MIHDIIGARCPAAAASAFKHEGILGFACDMYN